jgi:ATP-dependent DNA helicase DinG
MPCRFTPDAADAFRLAVREAGGVEVFAIGSVEERHVVDVTVTCRGQADRVTALIDRPRAGQVVIHNHPSGNLTASNADMQLASLYGEDGVGVVIVNNDVTQDNWVVEPHVRKRVVVDVDEIDRIFLEVLPGAIPGWETRQAQVEMAREVLGSMNEDRPVLVEAGTGTGKSLAYLVPAALWAKANDGKVIVSTYTRALQAQLMTSDLPMLARAGVDVETAVLQGRSNYVCKRQLSLSMREADAADDDAPELRAIAAWEENSHDGARTDIPFQVDSDVWTRIASDSDATLRARCPHYAQCRYYMARREAAAAHLVVVNHALLMVDLALRAEAGRGVLPRFHRLILDEGHHLEDAATSAASAQLTALAVRRATAPLLTNKKRSGALDRLVSRFSVGELANKVGEAEVAVAAVGDSAKWLLSEVHDRVLPPEGTARRVDSQWLRSPAWTEDVAPLVDLQEQLSDASTALLDVEDELEDVKIPIADIQPLMDIRRARRRLAGHAGIVQRFLDAQPGTIDDSCRWVERGPKRRGQEPQASVVVSPIEVAATLQRILWTPFPGCSVTSATLTVSKQFHFLRERLGLSDGVERMLESPFDHTRQAVLGLPKDLPVPNDPGFLRASAEVVVASVKASGGGAFVLCTSYAAVRHYGQALRAAGVRGVLCQGDRGRAVMLDQFRQEQGVLVGTDSFWEGVSVPGDALRMVIIPRLPFRVPTEPLRVARHELLKARGLDPFRAYSLPEAVIKLKQGYGRLIRTKSDRGVVLILDRRVHERRYGTIMLRSLPPARRVVGPWRRVHEELKRFYSSDEV